MISPPENLDKIKNLYWALPVVSVLCWWAFSASFGLSIQVTLIILFLVIFISIGKALYINLKRRYDVNYCFSLSVYLFMMFITPVSSLFLDYIFGVNNSTLIYALIFTLYFAILSILTYWHWKKLKAVPTTNEMKFNWEGLSINIQNNTWQIKTHNLNSGTVISNITIGTFSAMLFGVIKIMFPADILIVAAFIMVHTLCLFLIKFLSKKIAIALRLKAWQDKMKINLIHISLGGIS